jgi:hypothetical protein
MLSSSPHNFSFKWDYSNNLKKSIIEINDIFDTPIKLIQNPSECYTFHGLITWKGVFTVHTSRCFVTPYSNENELIAN